MKFRNELRSIDVHSRIIRPLVSGLKNTIAIDFYHTKEKDFVFWTDVMDDKVKILTLFFLLRVSMIVSLKFALHSRDITKPLL